MKKNVILIKLSKEFLNRLFKSGFALYLIDRDITVYILN